MTDQQIIDEIQEIRARNNVNWMDVVRMCFELAPESARSLFSEIKTILLKSSSNSMESLFWNHSNSLFVASYTVI